MTTYHPHRLISVLTRNQAEELLSGWLGTIPLHRDRPDGGGMINTVLRLQFDHEPHSAVIKLNVPGTFFGTGGDPPAMRERFPCPEVYGVDDSAEDTAAHVSAPRDVTRRLSMFEVGSRHRSRPGRAWRSPEALVSLHGHMRATYGPMMGRALPTGSMSSCPTLSGSATTLRITDRLPSGAGGRRSGHCVGAGDST